jgi:hypothetical protein
MKTVRARGLGIAFAVCGLAGAAGVAQAQSDSPSPCASITDDKSRLQCYDAEHALKKSQAARSSTPASSPAAAPAASSVPAPSVAPAPMPAPRATDTASARPAATSGSANSEFGSETLPKKATPGDAGGASEIQAKVASVAGQRKGDYRITLDNGQVWAETQRTGGEPPEPGDTVILRRGAMGSYFLSHGAGLALRVRRVK